MIGVSARHENEKKSENGCERNFKEDFLKNCFREWSNNSSRRRTHDCSEKLSSNSPRRVIQYIYRNSVVCFQEQNSFVLKTLFLLAFGLGMCEEVSEDSRHGIGHVDI